MAVIVYFNDRPTTQTKSVFFFSLHFIGGLTFYKCVKLFFSVFCLSFVDFEEPEDPSTRSFFSEIISSISDVKFSHNGRYLMTRDYLTVKVWDLQMENRPLETYQVRCHHAFI